MNVFSLTELEASCKTTTIGFSMTLFTVLTTGSINKNKRIVIRTNRKIETRKNVDFSRKLLLL